MMRSRKTKTPQGRRAEGAFNRTNSNDIFTYSREAIKARIDGASIAIWRACYALEEARQTHAALGHFWRQAGCCVALSAFQIFGGRTR
jgi:hypothetical protein